MEKSTIFGALFVIGGIAVQFLFENELSDFISGILFGFAVGIIVKAIR